MTVTVNKIRAIYESCGSKKTTTAKEIDCSNTLVHQVIHGTHPGGFSLEISNKVNAAYARIFGNDEENIRQAINENIEILNEESLGTLFHFITLVASTAQILSDLDEKTLSIEKLLKDENEWAEIHQNNPMQLSGYEQTVAEAKELLGEAKKLTRTFPDAEKNVHSASYTIEYAEAVKNLSHEKHPTLIEKLNVVKEDLEEIKNEVLRIYTQKSKCKILTIVKPENPVKRLIPVLGKVPAGFPDNLLYENKIEVDFTPFGITPTPTTFAAIAAGDSLTGRGIMREDVLVFESDRQPNKGEICVVIHEGESTMKIYDEEDGKPIFRATQPKYPPIQPNDETSIEGVFTGAMFRLGDPRGWE